MSEGIDLFAALSHTDTGRNLLAEFAKMGGGEYERDQSWLCEDGWVVEYTTTRVINGKYEGKFVTSLYKPVGPGARGGRKTARSWKRTYIRGFAKRKSARARAETLYWRHNPTRAAKYGKG